MRTLILDCNYLANMHHYAIKRIELGATFGFFNGLDILTARFAPCRIMFAFDGGYAVRLDIAPWYKGNRKPGTPEEKAEKANLSAQIRDIRCKHLPALGYRNIWHQRHYEADDLIALGASKCTDEVVIVSADQDLWQCISDLVWCYNPSSHKATTISVFRQEWGIEPAMWPHVKAIAGCSGDNVIGIAGVGEKGAAQWYAGTLKEGSVKYKKISEGLATHNRNLPLVRLPFKGAEVQRPKYDCLSAKRRNAVFNGLGFPSLVRGVA